MTVSLACRRFTLDDQQWFAALSGDVNPLHLDPVAARRSLIGGAVVHGVHAALWLLDRHLADLARRGIAPPGIARLQAQFAKPVYLDESVTAMRLGADPAAPVVRLQIAAAGMPLLLLEVTRSDAPPLPPPMAVPPPSAIAAPHPHSFADLKGLSAAFEPGFAPAAATGFPQALAGLGPTALAGVIGLSRLVGMECPGLHSLFAGFKVAVNGRPGPLAYRVERAEVPFAPVRIVVEGAGLAGTVDAFFRPPPVEQPGMAAVAAVVRPGEFAGQRALIVGGSRGLGEVVAKIVAAGGGTCVITCHQGGDDARRVASAITAAGGRCSVLPLDVRAPQGLAGITLDGAPPTHLYYFATPRISMRRTAAYEPGLFAAFTEYYVDGFHRVCTLARTEGSMLRVFYPSTVFLDEPSRGDPEYAMAKAAGETLCRHLDGARSGLSVLVRRLPRTATDQTQTLVRTVVADPLEVMLPVVRAMMATAGNGEPA